MWTFHNRTKNLNKLTQQFILTDFSVIMYALYFFSDHVNIIYSKDDINYNVIQDSHVFPGNKEYTTIISTPRIITHWLITLNYNHQISYIFPTLPRLLLFILLPPLVSKLCTGDKLIKNHQVCSYNVLGDWQNLIVDIWYNLKQRWKRNFIFPFQT